MLKDGLVYSESRMGYEQEFMEDLAAFELKSSCGTFQGGPVLFRKNDICYTDHSDSHDLIVGDTGSQKTLKFVLPLIYSCAMAGESMVIVDPKGELVRKSGEFLERKGYQKVVLNWRKPQESPDRWNPFERVQKAYKRGKRAESANHLNDVLQSLFFARTEKGKDPYWNDTAGQLARGISKLILMTEESLSIDVYKRQGEDSLRTVQYYMNGFCVSKHWHLLQAGRETACFKKIRFSRSFWNGSGKHRMQLQHWSRKICFGMQKRIMRNSWKICETWKMNLLPAFRKISIL